MASDKEDLLKHLRCMTDRTAKTIAIGHRRLSVDDLIAEIEKDTETGQDHVGLYRRAMATVRQVKGE